MFFKVIDIWELNDGQRAKLRRGQWVQAGPDGPKGRFYAQTKSTTIVAWLGNARNARDGYRDYMATIRDYADSILLRDAWRAKPYNLT